MDISQFIHLLGDQLGKVISELESREVYETEEQIRAEAKSRRMGDHAAALRLKEQVTFLPADQARAVAASFATYFDLVNLACARSGLLGLGGIRREARHEGFQLGNLFLGFGIVRRLLLTRLG